MIINFMASLICAISYSDDLTVVFDSIYQTGEWGKDSNNEGTSGSGSSLDNAKPYFYFLQDFLKEKNITSVVDAGCGDWQFSRFINWDNINYIGYDASKIVIEKNTKAFAKKNIRFIHENFINTDMPKADLLIMKEVLQHLSNENVHSALKQLSKYKYVIIVNDVDPITFKAANLNIRDGEYRLLDVTTNPFNIKGQKILTYKPKFSHEMKQVVLIEQN